MKLRVVTALTLMIWVLPNSASELNFTNVCPKPDVPYCDGVGKNAYNNSTNPPALQGIKLGKIVGVTWRPKGSVIGISEAIPAAGIEEEVRTSPRDAYYYMIDDGGEKLFVRQCREIDAKL